ncbi:hypothetical protein D3C72_2411270 [compost metagenome]
MGLEQQQAAEQDEIHQRRAQHRVHAQRLQLAEGPPDRAPDQGIGHQGEKRQRSLHEKRCLRPSVKRY